MLVRLHAYFRSIPAVFLDGCLYVTMAVTGFLATTLGSEEAFNMFSVGVLFWLKTTNGCILAAATALKMFRNTAYAEHQKDKEEGKA